MKSFRIALGLVFVGAAFASAAPLELKKGDRISIIGNTLADRMQHFGWLETFIQARHPEHELVIRNLGFSADTLTVRLRSAEFGTPDDWLTRMKTTVVFAFFGYNESFAGEAGLEQFKKDLADFLKHTLEQKYDGANPPRIVLFSPIAHEDLTKLDPNLADGEANNARLKLYAAAMAEVAKSFEVQGVTFVDLFEPSSESFAEAAGQRRSLTINGIHLNADGDYAISHAIQERLFGEGRFNRKDLEKLRTAVLDKNFYWYERYRTTDGFSIYGGRADTPKDGLTNRPVMAREMEVLDVMTANRDRRIWGVAQGKAVPAEVDDSNTPPFIEVKSNRVGPGPNGTFPFYGGEEAVKYLTPGKDLKVNLFASEEMFPEIVNPVQMAFDTKGRLWIAAWPSYPHWKPKDKPNDKLLILEDTDGDGRADVCKTFAGDLINPTGFEFWNGGVLVANAPELLFLKDTDGDDKYDVREMVIHGLDTADTHHTANSFTFDPGGAVYFQEGTFHHTQVETPWGPPRRVANGAVFRYEPRAQKFDVYVSHGFANPHGHVFDRWGQDIVVDGTGAVPYHGTLFSGHIEFPAKHDRPPTVYKQRTRPCPGIEILTSRHFPDDFMGNLLVPNVIGFQGILRYKLKDEGSSFGADELEPIVFSSDPNFRPTDVETAPDGSIYFVDWQNPIIGHLQHNLRDPNRDHTHGRIYRVTHAARPLLKPLPVAGEPIETLLERLREPEDRVRYRAKLELSARPSDAVVAAVKKWSAALSKNDPQYEHLMMEALWVCQHHNVVDADLLVRMLASPDWHARAASVRVLVAWRDRVPGALDLLRKAAADEAPRVRLEAIRAASFFTEPAAVEAVAIANEYPRDQYIDYLTKETLKTLDPIWKGELAAGRRIPMTTAAGQRFVLRNMSLEMLLEEKRTAAVCQELLLRPGLRDEQRREVLADLAMFEQKPELQLLLDAVHAIDEKQEDRDESIVFDLVRLLSGRSPAELASIRGDLEQLALKAKQPIIRQIGYTALINVDGSVDKAWALATRSANNLRDLLAAVPIMPDASQRAALYPLIVPLVDGLPANLTAKSPSKGTFGRYVRIELPGDKRTLTLAEVEVYSGDVNVARRGKASQVNVGAGGEAKRAVDGNKSGSFGAGGQTHTQENTKNPWWEIDLGEELPIDRIAIYNRTEGALGKRLDNFTLRVLDAKRNDAYRSDKNPAPAAMAEFKLGGGGPEGLVRRAAMNALASVRGQEIPTFKLLARFIRDDVDRLSAVRAVQRIPRQFWPADEAEPLLKPALADIRKTPPADRTSEAALDVMEFAETLAALLPADRAKAVRAELAELGVRVVRMGTLLERMSYDKDVLVVRAGKPVEIIFSNGDMMPHNLVIAQPGALEEIGMTSEKLAQNPAFQKRQYVPESNKILLASNLLQPRESQKLSFTAPTQAGVYPIVCTYPGHWRRMYAALYVVDDLDGYLADPAAYLTAHPLVPKDAMLADRRPRTEWKFDDLASAVADLKGRSYGNGKQMFAAAACVACHKLDGVGNEFGPDLTKYDPKWTTTEILKELLDPSARINEKYQTFAFETSDGKTITGLVLSETADTVKLIENPLAKTPPIDLKKADVESRVKLKTSIMPKGLLDKLSRDEILDLIAYVSSRADKKHPVFAGSGHDHGAGREAAGEHHGH